MPGWQTARGHIPAMSPEKKPDRTDPGSDDSGWYLVYSKPRQESLARANLERQGYQIYLPMCRYRRRRAGQPTETIEPLFPRYLFIRLNAKTDNWGPIRSTLGVSSLVRFGTEPAPVPETLIAFLRSREGMDGFHSAAQPTLQAGDRVRVSIGPMEGYEGILVAKTGRERVLVLMDVLGKQVRTQVDIGDLERP